MTGRFSNIAVRQILVSIATAFAFAIMAATPVLGDDANFYLTPGAGTYQPGQTISVQLRLDTGSHEVNAVSATLTYPTSKLQFNSFDTTGTDFEIQAAASENNGEIRIDRGTLSQKSGDLLVTTIKFTADSSSGSGAIAFQSSTIVLGSDEIGHSTSGATYNFEPVPEPEPEPEPEPDPAPGGGSGGSGGSSGSSGGSTGGTSGGSTGGSSSGSGSGSTGGGGTSGQGSSSSSTDVTPPAISNVQVSFINGEVVVTWITNEPATSMVEYCTVGYCLDGKFGQSAQPDTVSYTTSHNVTLPDELIEPDLEYNYRVVSADRAGNKAISSNLSFTATDLESVPQPEVATYIIAAIVLLLLLGLGGGGYLLVINGKFKLPSLPKPSVNPDTGVSRTSTSLSANDKTEPPKPQTQTPAQDSPKVFYPGGSGGSQPEPPSATETSPPPTPAQPAEPSPSPAQPQPNQDKISTSSNPSDYAPGDTIKPTQSSTDSQGAPSSSNQI